MKKLYFVLNLVFFSSKSLNLLNIQEISPQFIYFISISTCSEFQICGEFEISYSIRSNLLYYYFVWGIYLFSQFHCVLSLAAKHQRDCAPRGKCFMLWQNSLFRKNLPHFFNQE